ncbi:MAG: LytTR family DNA-binding domain-containing protein [Lacticaseibacillus paracasei]|uniref:LytR/AlgR family response regulator transcription factor n=1 Tax=Lacticaseibacillus paracasei TaxID=1597 RepID=UPI00345D0258
MTNHQTMLKIFILEDNADFLNFLESTLRNYIMIEALHAEIKFTTQSATDLLDAVDLKEINDCLFLLDIDIPGSSVSGIDIATILRKKSLYADIMFITSHTEEALSILAHKIAPLDLIDKSVLFEVEARLRSNIVYAIKRLKARQLQSPRLFNYSIDSNLFTVILDELLYIQTTPGISGTLELHAEREIATFPGNLKEVSLQYPTLFRCHRSILLNPTHISKLDTHGRFVYMDNQDKLEVSIRRVSALRQVMMTTNKPQSATNDLSNDA